ncbi:MAG: dienelactone hydrolase family protein [Candidatus Dormibacteraeota bacterium]|nr:dienelactone hydrolase family protein [Candidatus Dormibacteraeota bacterium]
MRASADQDRSATVGGVPIRWVTRNQPGVGAARRIALWIPFLGGTKDTVLPMLERLADAGFFAVSFDPWQHGDRSAEPPPALRDRLLAAFRRDMWPVLGQSTLEAMWVLDWTVAHHDVATGGVVAGGFSMGGDISVALAGIDQRVRRVAAIGSTPDWTRPGMRHLDGSGDLVDQGTPSAYGQWLYDHLNPITHLERYAHGPAILFECGQADDHVPLEAAHRFAEALTEHGPMAGTNIAVRITEGLAHVETVRNPEAIDRCLSWLSTA